MADVTGHALFDGLGQIDNILFEDACLLIEDHGSEAVRGSDGRGVVRNWSTLPRVWLRHFRHGDKHWVFGRVCVIGYAPFSHVLRMATRAVFVRIGKDEELLRRVVNSSG